MPAGAADQRGQGVAVEIDRQQDELANQAHGYSAATFRFASIWLIASTTASKVSKVEACRAL